MCEVVSSQKHGFLPTCCGFLKKIWRPSEPATPWLLFREKEDKPAVSQGSRPGSPSLSILSELCPERHVSLTWVLIGWPFVYILFSTNQMGVPVFTAHTRFSVWTVWGPFGGLQGCGWVSHSVEACPRVPAVVLGTPCPVRLGLCAGCWTRPGAWRSSGSDQGPPLGLQSADRHESAGDGTV